MEGIHLTALALLVLFGSNWVLYSCFWFHQRLLHPAGHSTNDENAPAATGTSKSTVVLTTAPAVGGGHGKKALSEPLARTLSSVRAFSGELARLGLVISFAYICEHHPPFPHSKRMHDMDMFWCVAVLLLISSCLNVRKSKGGDVLNREQTEEWKGWMQFMFLMYHYFSAHEVYNSIRVFITAYVWMTGFGNFSFFYLKGDYSAVRLLQMLWRLNFLVTLLCMTMDNHYILYYICPLHTFYFLVVYAIMAPASPLNYTKNGVRIKLLIAGAMIFCVWDLDLRIFEKVFWFLGRDSIVGASSGTMWEWYFRTSLDHWSTFLGMVFALNYPATAQWVKKVEAMPVGRQWAIKGSVAAVLLSATAWWARNILPLLKLDYNQKNAYFGVAIPVLTYIYVRNLTPLMRTRYLEPLHSLGKITLETYLMQHHIWLTSNAKTLLVLVPGYPKLNMVVLSITYVLVSRELYRLTMSLRGMCLPDNLSACLRNIAGIAAAVAACMGIAKILLLVQAGPGACVLVIAILGFGLVAAVHQLLRASAHESGSEGDVSLYEPGADGASRKAYDGKLLRVNHTGPVLAAVVVLLAATFILTDVSFSSKTPTSESYTISPDICVEMANEGMWKVETGECQTPEEASAYCNSHEWKWTSMNDQCHLHYMPPKEVRGALKGLQVSVVGDSIERFVYYALIRSYGEATPNAHNTSVEKHSDFLWEAPDESGTRISFLWAPLTGDLTTRTAEARRSSPDVLIVGGGLWDALYTHGDLEGYSKGTQELQEVINTQDAADKLPATLWVSMTNVVTDRLPDDKKPWLTEEKLSAYRAVIESSGLLQDVDGVVDGVKLTSGQRRESYDGVHYSDLTYDAFAQVAVNLVAHLEATGKIGKKEKPTVKVIAGMGNVLLGAMVLFLSCVMVLTRDAYHGLAQAALRAFGMGHFDPSSLSWDATYGDLLRKIGKYPQGPGSSGGGGHDHIRSSNLDDDGEAEKGLLDETERPAEGKGRREIELTTAKFSA